LIFAASLLAAAQAQTGGSPSAKSTNIGHSTKAMRYHQGTGSVKIEFQASSLMAGASGEAKVEAKNRISKSMPSSRAWKTPPSLALST
jgi:hypothetical protein